MTSRRGFTLIEALVAVVLLAIVGQAILRLLTVSQRLFRAQSERAALHATVRAGASLLPAELRELGPGDIVSLAPDRLLYRAMRSAGVACAVNAVDVHLRRDLLYGYRSIAPTRDSLLLFIEHDPSTATDDAWEVLPVSGAPGAGVCPDGGAAVVVPSVVPAATVGAATLDAPIRTFELIEERLYQSGGQYWLGSRSVSGGEATVQPVIGPLKADGIRLRYLNGAGSPTSMPSEVRLIGLTVHGVSDGPIVTPGALGPAVVTESLTADIELRNVQ
jgi:prepilin-type N-terminal cleavage/methylation domain-containing protein